MSHGFIQGYYTRPPKKWRMSGKRFEVEVNVKAREVDVRDDVGTFCYSELSPELIKEFKAWIKKVHATSEPW